MSQFKIPLILQYLIFLIPLNIYIIGNWPDHSCYRVVDVPRGFFCMKVGKPTFITAYLNRYGSSGFSRTG